MTDKETMAIIKQMVADGQISQEVAEKYFPELKSEDERIRNGIIEYIKINLPYASSWLAWLKKQGEQKPTLPKWKYKKDNTPLLRDSLILNKYGCVAKSPSGAIVSDVWIIDYDELAKLPKEESEKQGEQKPADKVEPKFKVGDEIKTKNEESLIITRIDRWGYWSEDLFICNFDDADKWELVEQKPADNTEAKGMNIVEEDMTPFQKKVFCIIDTTIEEEQDLKQVCDELLRLAHDEIMQNPAWSEEDKNMIRFIGNAITATDSAEYLKSKHIGITDAHTWLENLKDRVQPQPKQEWSEEDESIYNAILDTVNKDLGLIGAHRDWFKYIKYRLKSLRLQSHWKPTEEQMKCLSQVKGTDDHVGYVLCTLYNDLEKLMK